MMIFLGARGARVRPIFFQKALFSYSPILLNFLIVLKSAAPGQENNAHYSPILLSFVIVLENQENKGIGRVNI